MRVQIFFLSVAALWSASVVACKRCELQKLVVNSSQIEEREGELKSNDQEPLEHLTKLVVSKDGTSKRSSLSLEKQKVVELTCLICCTMPKTSKTFWRFSDTCWSYQATHVGCLTHIMVNHEILIPYDAYEGLKKTIKSGYWDLVVAPEDLKKFDRDSDNLSPSDVISNKEALADMVFLEKLGREYSMLP